MITPDKRPIFSQRHYEAIAKVLDDVPTTSASDYRIIVNDFAAMFLRDNPNFKPARFFSACGVTE